MNRAEVHALVGENGAGKSTLLNILTGVIEADAGEMFWDGRAVRLGGPRDARDLGIAFVHQELALVPQLTAAENLFLGRHPAGFGWVRWGEIRQRAARIFEELGHPIDPDRPVAAMSLAERQMVEVGRALSCDARLIILDEPTAALSEADAERLRRTVLRLRGRGISFVFVSHRLREVFEVADRITVLRDGRPVLSSHVSETNERDVVSAMAGPGFRERPARGRASEPPREILRVCGPIDLQVGRGEVVGLAGAAGAGCSEFLEELFGAGPRPAKLSIDGRSVTVRCPRDAIRHGLALVPGDRSAKGLIPQASLRANIVMAGSRNRCFIQDAEERRRAAALVSKLCIHADDLEQPVSSLSGGDQQKTVLARWLYAGATVFLLDEPTRGVDLPSKTEIHAAIESLASEGAGVLLASSDLEDLLRAAHRIVVMHRGRIAGELTRAEATDERILALTTGGGR